MDNIIHSIKKGWYNLEDKDNYDFCRYMVITETDDDRNFNLIDDYEEANIFKNKCKNDNKFTSVSKVWKINHKTNNVLFGARYN